MEQKLTDLDDGPIVWNSASDRTCNLSCPTCRTSLFALKGKEIDDEIKFQQALLEEIAGQLRVLYLSGDGDPLASVTSRRMFQDLASPRYSHLQINLHTNVLLWTRRNWEALDKINRRITTAHISIDAASAPTYAVNRRGGNWETLSKNLEFIAELRRSGPLKFVMVSFVVQANNYREMPAFVDLAQRLGFDLVQFHSLYNWGSFTPAEFEKIAVQNPWHPEYDRFLQVLRHESLGKPIAGLFTLAELRKKALRIRGGQPAFRWIRVQSFLCRCLRCLYARLRTSALFSWLRSLKSGGR